jgi:RNA polymerase sigma factor (TIGR02999 family)
VSAEVTLNASGDPAEPRAPQLREQRRNPKREGPENRRELDTLFSVTYEELRRLASSVKHSDANATLSPTTLVNEAWLKLARSPEFASQSRLHFKRIAARAMRQILIEAARRRSAQKRGGREVILVVFGDSSEQVASCDEELIALDAALEELARLNPRQATMIESRFFGGLDIAETAALLEVSDATILRDWRAAKAWLAHEIRHAR